MSSPDKKSFLLRIDPAVWQELERLAAADPTNAGGQRDLSASHGNVGDVLLAQGDASAALAMLMRSRAASLVRMAASEAARWMIRSGGGRSSRVWR